MDKMDIANKICKVLCMGIQKALNYVIFGVIVFELFLFVISFLSLIRAKVKIVAVNNGKKTVDEEYVQDEDNAMEERKLISHRISPKEIEKTIEAYDKAKTWYNPYKRVIPVFTLLGILGTVAGLYISVVDGKSPQEMYAGLALALSTTVIGIFCSLIASALDIACLARTADKIDIEIEKACRKYDDFAAKFRASSVKGGEDASTTE